MKCMLKYIETKMGKSYFHTITPMDMLIPGTTYFAEIKQPRSLRQNAFIHVVFERCWHNQRTERWENPEHLKAAALCAVGHCDIIEWAKSEINDMPLFIDFIALLISRIRGEGTYPILTDVGSHLQVRVARPWRFERLSHEEATKLMDPILNWLCSDAGPCPGVEPAALLKEATEGD